MSSCIVDIMEYIPFNNGSYIYVITPIRFLSVGVKLHFGIKYTAYYENVMHKMQLVYSLACYSPTPTLFEVLGPSKENLVTPNQGVCPYM